MLNTGRQLIGIAALGVAGALLAGCGSSGGDGSGPKTGTITLGITDGPAASAEEVVIQFAGVELKPKDGPPFLIDIVDATATPADTKTIDLLDYQGDASALLIPPTEIPAGEYEWVRLRVNAEPDAVDSYITIDGAQCELRIPSGAQSGLKLISGFTVGVGTTMAFTIDFDLHKSILQPPGQRVDTPVCDGQAYLLKPVLRMVNNLEVGTVSGTVDPTIVGERCAAGEMGSVYLYGPYGATDPIPVPDDIDGDVDDGADPIASALVGLDAMSNYAYTIGFVPAGNYVAAYTCDVDPADVNDHDPSLPPETDQDVNLLPSDVAPVVVTAGQTTENVDFGVPPAP